MCLLIRPRDLRSILLQLMHTKAAELSGMQAVQQAGCKSCVLEI